MAFTLELTLGVVVLVIRVRLIGLAGEDGFADLVYGLKAALGVTKTDSLCELDVALDSVSIVEGYEICIQHTSSALILPQLWHTDSRIFLILVMKPMSHVISKTTMSE